MGIGHPIDMLQLQGAPRKLGKNLTLDLCHIPVPYGFHQLN